MSQYDLFYLKRIHEAMDLVGIYLDHIDEGDFDRDPLIQDGMTRLLDFISELSLSISSDLKGGYADFPWEELANLNNRTGASGVDKDAAWEMARNRVPELKEHIEVIIEDLENEPP
jgi:uncharacterized protein with HEPN domain